MGTLGPWTADYDDNGFYVITADGMPSPYVLATGGEGDADKDNATLAAAAPDLLAVVEALAVLGHGKGTIGKPLADMARAALAKAEPASSQTGEGKGRGRHCNLPYCSVRLRNAPAPKASGKVWVNVFQSAKGIYVQPGVETRGGADTSASAIGLRRLACIEVPWTEGQGL